VVVIQWPKRGFYVHDNPAMMRVGAAAIYGDPVEVARVLSLLTQ
jgi:hypothetical protein